MINARIVHRIQKKDAAGNIYYVDLDGNRLMEEEERLTPYEQYYVDTEPEQWAEDRLRGEANWQLHMKGVYERHQMVVLNPLDKPEPAKTKHPLWGFYWHERETCIMAGDTGVGKTAMALQIGKHLAGGLVFGDDECVGRPRKVLYVDFEMDSEAFWLRYGDADESTENFYWAGFNAAATIPKDTISISDWLLDNLEAHIKTTGAEVLIIDQPDRLHIGINKRIEFLFKLQALVRKYKLSTMLVVNTRARNFSRPVELHHIQHHRIYAPMADSIIALAADYNNEEFRYCKPLKMRNRSWKRDDELYSFWIEKQEEKLALYFAAPRAEEDFMKKKKAALKEDKNAVEDFATQMEFLQSDELDDELREIRAKLRKEEDSGEFSGDWEVRIEDEPEE